MTGFFPDTYNPLTDAETTNDTTNSFFWTNAQTELPADPEAVPLDSTLTSNSFFITNPLEVEYTEQAQMWAELAQQYAEASEASALRSEYWAMLSQEAAENFEVVTDTSPQLGGDLDVNLFSIVSVSDQDIPITPDGSGSIVMGGLRWPASDGTNEQVLTTDGIGNLYWQQPVAPDPRAIESTDTFRRVDTEDPGGILATSNAKITLDSVSGVSLDENLYPTTDGTIGQFLTTNGSGVMVWTDAIPDVVTTVFGRYGDVVAEADDYTASQVENNSSVFGNYVSDALNTLDAGKIDNVSGVTANFTGILANGNISDSGFNSSSFATAAQGATADTAFQPGDIGDAGTY